MSALAFEPQPARALRGEFYCPCQSFGRAAMLQRRVRSDDEPGVVNYFCDNDGGACWWQYLGEYPDGRWHFLGRREARS